MQARKTLSLETRTVADRTVELSFSSDLPVDTGRGMETLSHEPGAVDLSRMEAGAAVLFEHDRTKQIGVVERAWIDYAARKGRAIVRFSRNPLADEVFRDIRDGIRRLVSVGYDVLKAVATRGGVLVTRWQPAEISIVSIPADTSVGVGRSHNVNQGKHMETKTDYDPMTESLDKRGIPPLTENEVAEVVELCADIPGIKAADYIRRRVKPDQIRKGILEQQKHERQSRELTRRFNQEMRANPEKFRKYDGNGYHASLATDGDLSAYSLTRALSGAASGRLDGLEAEWSQEIARRSGRDPMGIFIPLEALATRGGMTVTGQTSAAGDQGGNLFTPVAGGFIDALRPRLQVAALGATVLANLSSDVKLPRQSAASTASWATETGTLDEQSPTVDQVSLSPKRVGAFTQFSKQLLVQTDGSVENLVRNDLLSAIAIAIDAAAIAGTGADNQPAGILAQSALTKVALGATGAAPTFANLVALQTAIANANADAGTVSFLTNPSVRAKLLNTLFDSGSGVTVWDKAQSLGRWGISTNVPANLTKSTGSNLSAIIAGDFSQVIVGQFGSAADVVVDPYTKATEGITRVVVHAFADVAIRRAAYFAAIVDAVTT
jgi:HK97 family phage major capsid protein